MAHLTKLKQIWGKFSGMSLLLGNKLWWFGKSRLAELRHRGICSSVELKFRWGSELCFFLLSLPSLEM